MAKLSSEKKFGRIDYRSNFYARVGSFFIEWTFWFRLFRSLQALGFMNLEGFDETSAARYFDQNIERIRNLELENISPAFMETYDRQMYVLWIALSGTMFYAFIIYCLLVRNFAQMSLMLTVVPILKLCLIIVEYEENTLPTYLGFAAQNFQMATHQGVYIFLSDSCGFPTSTVNIILYLFFAILSCLALKEYKKESEQSFEMNKKVMRKHFGENKRSTISIRVQRQNRRNEKKIIHVPRYELLKIELLKIKASMSARIGSFFVKPIPATVAMPTATRPQSSASKASSLTRTASTRIDSTPAVTRPQSTAPSTTSTIADPTPAAFFDACRNGDKDVVRRLLSMTTHDSIDISTTLEEESGLGAYHLACAGGHLSIVQQLMTKFGKVICLELVSKDGKTGLELATESGRKNVVQVILNTLKGKQMR